MIHFRVDGPFEIELTRNVSDREIDHSSISRFWDRHADHAERTGCYVFGFRAGHGMIPAYVGQAKTGFRHECFQSHKLVHYHHALGTRKKGTPIMFFVSREAGTMESFESCIDHVERLLIQFAYSRNPHLENRQISDWCIQGVYRSKGGEPSEAAREFRALIGINPQHVPIEELNDDPDGAGHPINVDMRDV